MAPMILSINVGARIDITINELAKTIVKVVGFKGKLRFNTSRPACVPRKLLNVRRLKKTGLVGKMLTQRSTLGSLSVLPLK